MNLDKLRYTLTNHIEKIMSTYENFRLLIHPSIYKQNDLLNHIMDDIKLMPKIKPTHDKVEIKFYKYDYNENIFSKSELLAFVFAFINSDWDIIKGINLCTRKTHFWLKNEETIFDPSLSIITNENIYLKNFKQLKIIENENISNYLKENNNLYKFYNNKFIKNFIKNNNPNFSINFVNKILDEFNRNVENEYILDEERIKHIKQNFMYDNFIELKQVLTKKRKSFLESNEIAVHPSIDIGILEEIKKVAIPICELMKEKYNIDIDYYNNTLCNCYGLSIMFNLFDERFKLIQGGIPYERNYLDITTKEFYQHSWLEKDDIVYDPALRIVTPKKLYYIFIQKQDEYSKEETENILRRIGFNLTHFRDFINGVQIGNCESIRYKCLVNKIDTPKMKEKGEELIKLVKIYKR